MEIKKVISEWIEINLKAEKDYIDSLKRNREPSTFRKGYSQGWIDCLSQLKHQISNIE